MVAESAGRQGLEWRGLAPLEALAGCQWAEWHRFAPLTALAVPDPSTHPTPSSSTSNTKVACAGITGGYPRSP